MTAWEPSPTRPFGTPDIYIATAVFLISWLSAAWYLPAFRASGGHAEFYQIEFAPAVMSACGRGYVAPAERSTPPSLTSFLQQRTGTFDCADLPETIETTRLSMMQMGFRYLMTSAALVWRVRGVSWNAVDTVLSFLFATSLSAGYVALRFAAGRMLSITGVLLWLISPMHLGNLPHLRDYAKAPFFIVTVIAMGFVIRERRTSRLAIAGALFGLTIGVGVGMRTDVVLNFAPFLLALFAAGARGLREDLPAKLACATAALLPFAICAWPIMRGYADEGQGQAHVAVLGLTTPFDEPLGIRPAAYDFGYLYNDSYAAAEIVGDSTRSGIPASYARASRNYYLKLAAAFPGDFLTRMTAAVIQTLNLPFSVTYGRVAAGVSGAVARVMEWRARLMLSFIGTGPLVVILILVIAGSTRLRDAVVGVLLLLAWTAYPFIQFHGRHTFHLEFLVIAAFMALLSLLGRSATAIWNGRRPAFMSMARAAAVVLTALVVAIVIVTLARAIQRPGVRTLLDAYDRAATESLTSVTRQTLIRLDADCRTDAEATVRYDAPKNYDFTRTLTLPAQSRTFVPVYPRFAGIDGPACVRVSRVRGIDQLLWMDATLTQPDSRPLNQRVYIGTAFPTRVWLKLAQWWPSISSLG